MSKTIDIIGLGARTSVGWDALSTAASVRAGLARFAEYASLTDCQGNPVAVAMAPYLAPEICGSDRFLALGIPAAEEALSCLANSLSKGISLDILIGLPLERPGLPKELGDDVIKGFEKAFAGNTTVNSINVFAKGHAAGLMALQLGRQRILDGKTKACLIGGIDHYLTPETMTWLDKNEQLLTEANPWGFVPGEGAGFCLLASSDLLEQLKCQTLGQVASMALAHEKNLIKTDTVCLGEGMTAAIRETMQPFHEHKTQIDDIICDLNGEPYRAEELSYALLKTGEHLKTPDNIKIPMDCWGDVGAASGPLYVILAIMAGQKGYAKGLHTMILTGSESGERCVGMIRA
jgi:3-oxoacyl-[acyl-carrier-protein] synthase-1